MYKKARSLGDQALLSEESFIRIPDDQTMVSDMDICFPCRSGHTYQHFIYKKTPQSLAGPMFYRYSLHLFNSKTCPAIGIIPIGTKPGLYLFMEYHVAHFLIFLTVQRW